MSDDLVKRLRRDADYEDRHGLPGDAAHCRMIAAEIERLRAALADQHVEITHWHGKFEAAEAQLAAARGIIGMFIERIDRYGEWDDGCFYYRGTSASELQEPLQKGRAALARVGGKK